MTQQQAITELDNHLVWLAKRRLINNFMLQKLSNALLTIAQKSSDADAVIEAEQNSIIEKYLIENSLLQTCGLTKKGIERYKHLPEEFRENYKEICKKGEAPPPTTETKFEYMLTVERQCRTLAEHDIDTLNSYVSNNIDALKKLKKKSYPYLKEWFEHIDRTGTYNKEKAFDKFYIRYIQWN